MRSINVIYYTTNRVNKNVDYYFYNVHFLNGKLLKENAKTEETKPSSSQDTLLCLAL